MKHPLKRGLAVITALALCLALLPAAALAISYKAPSRGMAANNAKYLTGATAGANTVVLSVLGVNVTSSNTSGLYNRMGNPTAYGTDSSNLGVFGSDINDSPDPYIYNFFCNLFQTRSGGGVYSEEGYAAWNAAPYALLWDANKSGSTGQASGTVTITVGGVTKTTNPAFFYEPDILLGGVSNGYAKELANYQSEYNADYDPTVFLGYDSAAGGYAAYGSRSDGLGLVYNQFDMCAGVVCLGAVVQNLMAETGKVNRYDEGPYEIAVNYDKFDRGLYYYVLSELESGALTPVRYVSDLSYDSASGFYAVSRGDGRSAQYVSGVGVDVFDLLEAGYAFSDGSAVQKVDSLSGGDYLLTADQLIEILNAPTADDPAASGVVVGASPSAADPTGVLSEAGVRFLSNLPSCVYDIAAKPTGGTHQIGSRESQTVETVENGMGIPFCIGFFYYDQNSALNPVNYIYYWMEHFYHISDADAMENVVNNMLASSDLPVSLAFAGAQVSDYSADAVEAQITAGIDYYTDVLVPQYDAMAKAGVIGADSALYWTTLDTAVGIGSHVRYTNAGYTFTAAPRTDGAGGVLTDGYGNIFYNFTFTPVPERPSFPDVADGAFYAAAVDWAVKNGVTSGTGNNLFSPLRTCTRAEIVTFLWRYAGKPAATASASFPDVAGSVFYAAAVDWAVEKKITSGTGNNLFSPLRTCTRAEAATFLYRADQT